MDFFVLNLIHSVAFRRKRGFRERRKSQEKYTYLIVKKKIRDEQFFLMTKKYGEQSRTRRVLNYESLREGFVATPRARRVRLLFSFSKRSRQIVFFFATYCALRKHARFCANLHLKNVKEPI